MFENGSDDGYARAVYAYAAQELEFGVPEDEVLALLRTEAIDTTTPTTAAEATTLPSAPSYDTHRRVPYRLLALLQRLLGR